jgi:hypothetical protein
LLLLVIAFGGGVTGLQAATLVSGGIIANTTWTIAQSPYQVTGDISIGNGAILTIEPGVTVYFNSATNLVVSAGGLIARGTNALPIIFTSALDVSGSTPAPGDWGQLRFMDGTNDVATILEYAQIRYGQSINIQSASPTLNNLQISNNNGAAITIDLNSSPQGIGNQASGNTLNGVSVPAGDMTSSVTWGIKGIPYVVAGGTVSVGVTPLINSISYNQIQQGDTLNATLNGVRLSGANSLNLSVPGVSGTILSGATDTSVPVLLTALPAAALGSADLNLQVAAGRANLAGALQIIQPQPIITALSPASLFATQTNILLAIGGKNFVPGSVIVMDGVELVTTYISATSLSTSLPLLSVGNKSITVKQPDPLLSGAVLVSKAATLSVTIPSLSLNPITASQTQGLPLNLTVGIPFAAAVGGVAVDLASSAPAIATVPATVNIAEGATTASVPVTTAGVGFATITASKSNFTSASAQVQVLIPPTLTITSTKLTDVVGNNFSLAINSSNTAGAGGLVVTMTSSNTAVATIPASVIIPAGTKTTNVQVAAVATGVATITAQANGYVVGSTTVTVRPITQSMTVSPLPVAIPPDNVARKITLRLAALDSIDQVFAVSVNNATVASIGASSVTIPAGQISAQLSVTGLKEGSATITLNSLILGVTAVPVYVTVEYAGINMSYAPSVGIVKEFAAPVTSAQSIAQFSPNVGVAYGHYITGITPNLLTIGTGPTTVTINGDGLQNTNAVNISPADGLTVGTFTANPDGKSVTVPVTVAANAPTTLRQVIVSSASGQIKAVSPNADRLLISLPLPEVTSVDPLFAVPGAGAMTLTVRGRNFQNAQSITISPADNIAIGGTLAVSADGTQLTTTLNIDTAATHGPRVVQVTTLAGTSDGVVSALNTFTLVSQVQNTLTPIASPMVGLIKEATALPPANQSYGLFTTMVGITKGSAVSAVSPNVGAIGDTITMTITGNELQNVTAVQFTPNTNLTVGTPVIAADGNSMTLSVVIDAAAQLGARSVKVLAGTTALPFSRASDASFNVILPLANITSIEPLVLTIPSTALTLAVNGTNLQNASIIRITPGTDVTIANPPVVNSNGTRATVSINIAAAAASGNRLVSIVTPAGESSMIASVGNTVTLTTTPGSSYDSLPSPVVGLVKEVVAAPPVTATLGPVASPLVGVMLETVSVPPTPTSMNVFQPSPQVGVLFGALAYTFAPEGLLAGISGTLSVSGIGLDGVTSVTVNPSAGISLGSLQVSPDGTQLTVPVSVASNASVGYYGVVLNRTGGTVSFANAGSNIFWVANVVSSLDSVTPNLATRGTTVSTFTIRGSNFQNATAVVAEPPDGIVFGAPSVDGTGTVLTVNMVIDPAAPTSARVIRVSSHGVMSSAVAVPANTFTVYP